MYRDVLIIFTLVIGLVTRAQNQNLIIFNQDILLIDNEGNHEVIIENPNIDLSIVKLLQSKKHSYLINKSSGVLHEIISDTIIRIDQSYDDKIHNYSLDFIHRDTLFRFGGYGYFNSNKNLIFFDEKSKEWDVVKYKGYRLIDGFSNVQTHFIKKDKLYVLGYSTTDNKYQNENSISRKGFIYNFNNRSIEKTFEIDESFIFPKDYVDVNDDMIFLFPYTTKQHLRILDKNSLKLFQYKLSIGERNFTRKDNRLFKVVGDNLIYTSENVDKKTSIKSMFIDQIIENKVELDQRVVRKNYLYHSLLFALIIVIILYIVYREKNKGLRISSSHLLFHNDKLKLDKKSIEIVQMLIKKPLANNNELNELFYREGLSSIHINRQKNNYIDKINTDFYIISNKELIIKQKMMNDKRLVEYFLNPEIYKHK